MLSRSGRECASLSEIYRNGPVWLGPSSPKWKMAMAILTFRPSQESPQSLDAVLRTFLRRPSLRPLETLSCGAASPRQKQNGRPRTASSPRSRKSTAEGSRPQQPAPWHVVYHREALKSFAALGALSPKNPPLLKALEDALKSDPYQFPSKTGPLKGTRAAPFTMQGVAYRMVYVIDKVTRTVRVGSVETHDRAYRQARQRAR